MRKITISFFVLALILFSMKKAFGVNEYLNSYSGHCSKGSVEVYTEMSGSDDKYTYMDGDGEPSNSYRGYDDAVRGTIGLRWRKELGSTCTNQYKDIMLENERLRQELELLKLCARYQELELGYQFATVREKCRGVKRKNEKEKVQIQKETKSNSESTENISVSPKENKLKKTLRP